MSKNNAKGNVNLSKHEKVLLLLEFFDKFGRWPKSEEKYMGLDIGRFGCNVKYSRTRISSEDYDILEEKGLFENTREGQKNKKIMLLLEFYDLFGRWPKSGEKYKGVYIGTFARSIKHFKVSISNKDKSVLEEKNFFSTREQKKHKRVKLLIEFHDKYKRWPKRSEKYKNENIGRFVNTIKCSNIILSDEDYETLKKMNFFYSNYKHKIKKENNVNYSKHEKVLSLLEFYDKTGRFPKASEKYKMLDIGVWAINIKQNNKSLSKEDYRALEEKNFFITLEQKRHNKVLLLLEFFDRFGRWPKRKEEYKGEKIGVFVNSIKTLNTKLSKQDYDILEKKRFFNTTSDEKKHQRVLLLLEFFDRFGRWPKSTEIYKSINIGSFAQNVKYFKINISNKDKNTLEKKDFFISKEEKKHRKVMLLIEFHDRYGRWPKFNEKYKNENIGNFIYNIKHFKVPLSDEDYRILEKAIF